jgi:hypothetical protein
VDTQNEEDTEEDIDRHRMVRNEMVERWGRKKSGLTEVKVRREDMKWGEVEGEIKVERQSGR